MKFCEKHNFEYMDYVKRCPFCAGETMTVPCRPAEEYGRAVDVSKQAGGGGLAGGGAAENRRAAGQLGEYYNPSDMNKLRRARARKK